jgi:hypothetical protein
MAANFPGMGYHIPSCDAVFIDHDVSDKGHDWGEMIPWDGDRYIPYRAGTWKCKICGLVAYSLKDDNNQYTVNSRIVSILNFAPDLGQQQWKNECAILVRRLPWVAVINEQRRLEYIKSCYEDAKKYKDNDVFIKCAKKAEAFNPVDWLYSNGAQKVCQCTSDRISFEANSVTAWNFKCRIGVDSVEERYWSPG